MSTTLVSEATTEERPPAVGTPSREQRPRWVRRLGLALAVVGIISLTVGGVRVVQDRSTPAAAAGMVLDIPTLRVEYSDAPTTVVLGYEHGSAVRYALELTNDGPVPITIEDVPIADLQAEKRLLHPTGVRVGDAGAGPDDAAEDAAPFAPFTLGRGETRTIVVEGVFYNCIYYTERAVDLVTELPVTWSVLGVTTSSAVALPEQVAVRSPYLRVCPGRVMDRGAMTRTDGG